MTMRRSRRRSPSPSSRKGALIGLVVASLLSVAEPAMAQDLPRGPVGKSIHVEQVDCLSLATHRDLPVTVEELPPGARVRVYFRRLNPIGAFYFIEARPQAEGSYVAVLPLPEPQPQEELTDDWWSVLQTRDWMRPEGRDRDWLESWLSDQEVEAAEYYAAIYSPAGDLVERSEVKLVPVLRAESCPIALGLWEMSWADNLTVGESTDRQADRLLFHWLCNGVVTRISAQDVFRADGACRSCVGVEAAVVGDSVWRDENGNGLRDRREPGIAGVTLELWPDRDADGVLEPGADDGPEPLATTVSDAQGYYRFSGLDAGSYFVLVTDRDGVLAGLTLDAGTTNPTPSLQVSEGEQLLQADFGYQLGG
jgi:hypothetical protein